MKDNWGDKISVHGTSNFGNPAVYLAVTSKHDDSLTDASLTPDKARKLAKKLNRAADEADGGEQVTFDNVRPLFEAARYLLDLTQAEAETLAVVLHKVGGSPDDTARRYTDSVADKLRALGLDASALTADPRFSTPYYAAIYFEGRA